MVKIIKKGTRKIEKCTTCGCEFSYEREDLCLHPILKTWIINCPQCNNAIKILEQKETTFDE